VALFALDSFQTVRAAFVEDFDTFALGTLTAQESWEAHPDVNVVTNATGRALKIINNTSTWTRQDATGVDFDLSGTEGGIEYGFDVREEYTTVFNARMFLREGAAGNYSPSFGFKDGKIVIRPDGESGADIFGHAFYETNMYGVGTAEDPGYWVKGDELQVKLILTGAGYSYATVKAYNLSRGGLEIPTGLVNTNIGRAVESQVSGWNRITFRCDTSYNTAIDNAYVVDYVAPLAPFEPFSDDFESYTAGTVLPAPWSVLNTNATDSIVNVVNDPSPFSGGTNAFNYYDESDDKNPKVEYDFISATTNPLSIKFDFKLNTYRGYAQFQIEGDDGGTDMQLALTRETSELANQTGSTTYQLILDTDVGTWYHVEILTSAINPSGNETYDISVTPFGGAATVVTNLTFRNDVDTKYTRVQFAQNSTANAKCDIVVDNFSVEEVVDVIPPYIQWTQLYKLSGTNADYYANPDGDALNNLYEWGLGGDPTNEFDQGISPTYGMALDGDINWFIYVYPSNSIATDLVYFLETDTDLVVADWSDANYEVAGISAAVDGFSYVTNRISTAVEDQQFVRLVIEEAP